MVVIRWAKCKRGSYNLFRLLTILNLAQVECVDKLRVQPIFPRNFDTCEYFCC